MTSAPDARDTGRHGLGGRSRPPRRGRRRRPSGRRGARPAAPCRGLRGEAAERVLEGSVGHGPFARPVGAQDLGRVGVARQHDDVAAGSDRPAPSNRRTAARLSLEPWDAVPPGPSSGRAWQAHRWPPASARSMDPAWPRGPASSIPGQETGSRPAQVAARARDSRPARRPVSDPQPRPATRSVARPGRPRRGHRLGAIGSPARRVPGWSRPAGRARRLPLSSRTCQPTRSVRWSGYGLGNAS